MTYGYRRGPSPDDVLSQSEDDPERDSGSSIRRVDDGLVDGDPATGGDPAPDPEPDPPTRNNDFGRSPSPDEVAPNTGASSGGGSSGGASTGAELIDEVTGGSDQSGSTTPGFDTTDGGSSGGGSDTEPDTDPEPNDIPEIGVGSGPTPDDFKMLNESNLRNQAAGYRENVADPIGTTARRASPASLLDQALPGEPVGRTIENFTEGAVGLGNVPAIGLGAISVADRVARDTRRANEQGAAGRRKNREELAEDAIDVAVGTGRAIQQDPVATLSSIAGGAVGGAVVGGAASRALRGTPDVDTPGSSSAVPSGRSNVGTGGVDSLLDDVDIDAERGITGPSTRSRVQGDLSRTIDDATTALGDSRLGDFVDDVRGQAQIGRQRSRDEPDFGDVPDRTRPADAGGTFEDVRQDALTQTQDDLRGRGQRPDLGDYDGAPQPFRDRGGDTIDPDAGVQLERGGGIPDFDVGLADELGTSSTAGGASGSAAGTAGGIGVLNPVNDPTRIATTFSPTATQPLSPINDPTGITDTQAGTEGGGVLGPTNDPSGVTDGADDLTDPLGDGSTPGGVTDTGTDTDFGTDPLGDTGIEPVTGTEPGTVPFADTPTDTDVDVGTDSPPVTAGRTDTPSTTDIPGLTDTEPPGLTGTPTTPNTGRGGRGGRGGGFGGGFGGGTFRRSDIDPTAGSEDEEERWWLEEDADEFASGIASADELEDDLENGDIFSF